MKFLFEYCADEWRRAEDWNALIVQNKQLIWQNLRGIKNEEAFYRAKSLVDETTELAQSLFQLSDYGLLTTGVQTATETRPEFSKRDLSWIQRKQIPFVDFLVCYKENSTERLLRSLAHDRNLLVKITDYRWNPPAFVSSCHNRVVVTYVRTSQSYEGLLEAKWNPVSILPETPIPLSETFLDYLRPEISGYLLWVNIATEHHIDLLQRVRQHAEQASLQNGRIYENGEQHVVQETLEILAPEVTLAAQKELQMAADWIRSYPLPPVKIDEDFAGMTEYNDEIYEYMRELEMRMLPKPYYSDTREGISLSMRSALMDWVIEIHWCLRLLPEVLFLAVNYIDRFLSVRVVSPSKLPLLGAVCIFVSAKYEQRNCPSVQSIAHMAEDDCTVDEILKGERSLLSELNFELGWPGPLNFVRHLSRADNYQANIIQLAGYFLEVIVMDGRFIGNPPSFLSAGSYCLARLLMNMGTWGPSHMFLSGYVWGQLKPLLSLILDCCTFPKSHHPTVYKKYAGSNFGRVSVYVEDRIREGISLP